MVTGHFQVKVFTQPHYLHNFVQSSFNALSADKVRGGDATHVLSSNFLGVIFISFIQNILTFGQVY